MRKKILSIVLALCMIPSTAFATDVQFYNNESDTPSKSVYSGEVVAAVNQNLSADKLVKETFSSEMKSDSAQNNSLDASEADGYSIIDTKINPETGEMTYVTEPHFDMPTPQTPPEGSSPAANGDEALKSAVSVGSTKVIKDNNGVSRTLKCLYIGKYCTVWGCTSDKNANSGLEISTASATEIGQQFDSYCPSVISSFGKWFDADNDDKLAIYCYDIDQNYINGVSGSYTAGYFMPANLIDNNGYVNGIYVGQSSKALGTDCIHLDTYPAMSSSRTSLFDSVEDVYSTLVHEAQHLINYSYLVEGGTKDKYYSGMETYLNEAFSMAAEHIICGAGSTSNRISYFNSESYTGGSPLTYWAGNLSNYANSYLFGQYLRTRYAQKTGSPDGNTIFKNILEARQKALGGDTLALAASTLGTKPTQLVMDFWAAVYLKQSKGNYGFNGESWANAITPKLYSPQNAKSIYNGGAVFYNSTVSTSQNSGIGFITFNGGKTEMSGAPELSNVAVERTGVGSARLSFDSSQKGTLWYTVSKSRVTDRSSMTEFVDIQSGHNSYDISMELDSRQEGSLSYYVENSASGQSGDVYSAWIPAVEYPIYIKTSDRGTVSLNSNGTEISSGDYVKFGAEVEVTAEAKPGYYVKSIMVDDNELADKTFTVNGTHSIRAVFSVEEMTEAGSFHNGEGTEENPYMIDNVAEWKYFVSRVNSGDDMSGKFVALSNDIDFEGQTINPVGISKTAPFNGSFDGRMHTLKNLKMSLKNQQYAGIFGYNGGNISNVKLDNVSIESTYVGGTGYAGTVAGYNAGNIEYIAIQDKTFSVDAKGYSIAYIGGVTGYNSGTIKAAVSHSRASFDDQDTYPLRMLYIGGISGYCDTNGEILYCECDGPSWLHIYDASPASRVYFGGIVGYTKGLIKDCIYAESVGAAHAEKALYAGSIAGYQAGGSIKNAYVYEPKYGSVISGKTTDTYYGGIVGYQNSGTIDSCVSYQKCISMISVIEANIGYIAAKSSGKISNCYYNSGQTYTSIGSITKNGTATDASNLMSKNFLASIMDFDMVDVWEIGARPGVSNPTLREFRKMFGYKVSVDKEYKELVTLSDEWAYANTKVSVYAKDETKYVKAILVDGVETPGNTIVVTGDCTIVPILGNKYKVTKVGDAVSCVTLDKQYAAPGEKVTATISNSLGEKDACLVVNGEPVFNNTLKVEIEIERDTEIDVAFADASSSGTCGNGVKYKLFDEKYLYIYGKGTMYNFDEVFASGSSLRYVSGAPWCASTHNYGQDIEYIHIGEGVTNIGERAFFNCKAIKNIDISNSVIKVGSFAFSSCSALERIIIPSGVTEIAEQAFSSCYALKNIEIPDGVTEIAESAFSCCYALKNIEIPDSVTQIGISAFFNCTSLESIKIPDGVTVIDDRAFRDCSALKNIEIPDSVTQIGDAFYGCTLLESIKIPDGITEIDSFTFYGCSALERVIIPNSVKNIFDRAFDGCSKLKDVLYVGDSSEWSEIYVGSYNSYLTKATIHYFKDSSDIAIIKLLDTKNGVATLSKTITQKGETVTVQAAPSVGYQVSKIKIDGVEIKGNSFVATGNHTVEVIFALIRPDATVVSGGSCGETVYWTLYEDGELVIYGEGDMKDYTGYLSSIPWYQNRESIVTVVVENGVTSISRIAFYGYPALKSIVLSNSVETIGENAFYSLWWPQRVYYIGNSLEWDDMLIETGNDRLTEATRYYFKDISDIPVIKLLKPENGTVTLQTRSAIGETVTITATPSVGYRMSKIEVDGVEIKENIFGYSFVVTGNHTVKVTFVPIRSDVMIVSGGSCGKKVYWTLYEDGELVIYGKGYMDFYPKLEAPWKENRGSIKSVIIENGVTSVCESAFYGCAVENIILPDSVRSIGDMAFLYCSKLSNVRYIGTSREWDNISIGQLNSELLNAKRTYYSANGKGDVDGNYNIDSADVLKLRRFLAQWKGYDNLKSGAADLDSDGEITLKDITILERHIAGWRGYEKLPVLDK